MATKPLPDELKAAGAKMLAALDAIGLEPQGALWLHYPLVDDWRYVVITALVSRDGRRKIYGLIDEALMQIGQQDGLSIMDIHLYDPSEIVPRNLSLIGVENATVNVVEARLNGMLVNAFLYRLKATPGRTEAKHMADRFERTVRDLVAA